MLRALVAALILANLVFFGWARGWFAPGWPLPHHGEREPERLAAQVRPEAVALLPPKAASAALNAARAAALVCLEAGPFGEDAAAGAEAALASAQVGAGRVVREPMAPGWLVFGGRYAEAVPRRAREDELRKFGISFEALVGPAAPPELAPGIVLSRHPSREAAEAALAAVAASAPRLRGARVLQLPPPPSALWLRAAQADAELAEQLKALPPEALAGGFKPCVAVRP